MAGVYYPGEWAGSTPHEAAVIMAGSGERTIFAELDQVALRLSRTPRELGLAVGDHVVLCLENRLEFLHYAWAAHYAGLYYTFISTHLTADEAAYIVNDCAAKLVVLSEMTATKLAPELSRS